MILALGAPLALGAALAGSWLHDRTGAPPARSHRAPDPAVQIRVLPGRLTLNNQLVWQGAIPEDLTDQPPGDPVDELRQAPCHPPDRGDVSDPLSRGLLRGLKAHRLRVRRSFPNQDFTGAVHICAHPEARFAVLRRILTASRRTGHDQISIGRLGVVTTQKVKAWRSDCDLVPLLLPYSVRSARSGWPPEMRVPIRIIIDEDFTLTAGAERLRLPSKGGHYQRLGLEKKLRVIRTLLPHKQDLEVSVADRVLHRDLMDALEIALSTGFNKLSLVDRAGSLLCPQPPLD